MNQKSKKHIVKSLAIFFSVTALLTNANLLTSYAAPPTKNSQNESTDESCTKRPHDESTDEPQAKRPRNETTTSQSISKEKFFNAARNGRTETVELLLERGADIDAVDRGGNTAMTYAVEGGRMEGNRKHLKINICKNCSKKFKSYDNKDRKYCSYECYINDRFKKQKGEFVYGQASNLSQKKSTSRRIRIMRTMLKLGLITKSEYDKIDTKFLKKHSLIFGSLYR